MQEAVYELDVHKVELEMQNESLRAALAELEEMRDRYQELYDRAPVGYVALDAEGRIRDINQQASHLLRAGAERVVGRPLVAFLRGPDADAFHRHLWSVRTSRAKQGCDVVLSTDPAVAISVRIDSAPVLDDGGDLVGFRSVITDLSDLRQTEAQLRSAEVRGAVVLDTSGEAIITLDADGRIEAFNRAAEKLFGYREGEVLGKDVRMLVSSSGEREGDIQRILGTAQAIVGEPGWEVVARRKNGTTFPVDLGVGQFRDRGRRKITVVAADLSERWRHRAELQQARKLGAVGSLATGMAHDFGNVLSAIVGCINVAQAEETPSERAAEYLARAIGVAQRGGELSRRLLALSRQQPFRPVPLVVDEVVESIVSVLERLVTEPVTIRLLTGAPGATVLADRAELEQLLLNLGVNARDAMPEGGILTIRTDILSEGDASTSFVRIVVEDTGVGMAESVQQRMFEPFFSTKDPAAGSGLGLSTVPGAMDRLGGCVEVDSRQGAGTRIFLRIPRCEQAAGALPERAAQQRQSRHRLRGLRALLVEDEPLVRMALRHELERLGVEVAEAGVVGDAITVAEASEDIDVVVSDAIVPHASAEAFAERLRQSRPQLPVLFVSANPEALHASERMGVVAKPLRSEAIAQALVELLAEPEPPPATERAGPAVLVVEDDGHSGRMLVKLLELEGREAVLARDAAEALTIVDELGPPGVLVTDVLLGGGRRGDELAAELRRQWPDLPVVYVSGHPDVPDGATAFVAKPIDFDALYEAVATILDGD